MAIVASCIGCDQVTKGVAVTHLKGHDPRAYCGGVVRLEYAENPGAFLSIGAQLPPMARLIVLTVVNGLLMAAIAAVLVVRWDMLAWHFLAGTLLLSGGIGNLIDRVRFEGLVVDFLNLGIGPLRTGIFNVADLAITMGAIVLVLARHRANPATAPIDQA
ncbi:MAG: signal peptidase II [Planctomycetia bacterium]|nr:signal peptidase II [Planctomycetia bacterium]